MANEGEVVEFATEKKEGDWPFFSEGDESVRKLVLDEMGLTGAQNEVYMFSAKVVGFTAETKAQAGEYQPVRGYAYIEPRNFLLHIPVYNPGQLVGVDGNLRIFGQVFNQLATELDVQVVDVANRRLDRNIVKQDQEAGKRQVKARRVDAGKGVSEPIKKTEQATVEML